MADDRKAEVTADPMARVLTATPVERADGKASLRSIEGRCYPHRIAWTFRGHTLHHIILYRGLNQVTPLLYRLVAFACHPWPAHSL